MEADDPHQHRSIGVPRCDFNRLSTIRERSSGSRSSSKSNDSEFFSDLPLPPVPTVNDPDQPPRTPSEEFLYSRMVDFDDEPAAASREDLRSIDSSTTNMLHKSSWSSASCSVDEGILYLDGDDGDYDERSSAYRDKSPILRSLSASPELLLQQQRRRRRRKCRRRKAGEFTCVFVWYNGDDGVVVVVVSDLNLVVGAKLLRENNTFSDGWLMMGLVFNRSFAFLRCSFA